MKKCLMAFIVLSVGMAHFSSAAEDLLKIEASIQPRRLRRGEEGNVVLKITVKEGIKISSQPSFTIELAPSAELIFPKNFFSASDLEIEIVEEDGKEYLSLREPIEIPFTVKMGAKRGNHSFLGKVKYFACSKEEGWCLKYTSKFATGFYTSSRIYQKKN
ncbi:hypothetical protein ACFLT2_09480 [Acidobacteriota bacterium]